MSLKFYASLVLLGKVVRKEVPLCIERTRDNGKVQARRLQACSIYYRVQNINKKVIRMETCLLETFEL